MFVWQMFCGQYPQMFCVKVPELSLQNKKAHTTFAGGLIVVDDWCIIFKYICVCSVNAVQLEEMSKHADA